jgi:hypothetical protein
MSFYCFVEFFTNHNLSPVSPASDLPPWLTALRRPGSNICLIFAPTGCLPRSDKKQDNGIETKL